MVQCGDILWSLSHEPIIVGFNLRKMEVECVIPTFKGATMIVPSLVDPTRVAIGGTVGTESVIRVLNCTEEYPTNPESCLKAPMDSHKLKGKLSCVSL
jgi:hypothetical protein